MVNGELGCNFPIRHSPFAIRVLCFSPAWWLWRSVHTRSHLELGRKSLQLQWYFVLRRGRGGRRQACEKQNFIHSPHLLRKC